MARAPTPPAGPKRPIEGRPPHLVRNAGGKGRGARSNRSGRYEAESRFDVDDGWGEARGDGDGPAAERTTHIVERPRTILTFNKSPYVGFDRSINPYRGCEHGCVYCFARPTHAFMGLSPGLDFETKIFVKPDAGALLRREFSAPGYRPRPVALGTNTDPYQPAERRYRIMRDVLTACAEFGHPLTILTKSAGVLRDLDLLSPLAQRGLVRATLSITTCDPALARALEPRASAPAKRFDAVRALADAGVETGVMTAPMIPALNDHELEALLTRAAEAGASHAGYTMIRLPLEVSPLFQEWLAAHAPDRAGRVMRHIREHNGGRDYDARRSRGREVASPYVKLLAARFRAAAARLGLDREPAPLRLNAFRAPNRATPQLSLFDESSRS